LKLSIVASNNLRDFRLRRWIVSGAGLASDLSIKNKGESGGQTQCREIRQT